MIWTASTIKLAMVVDLLTRARTGQITLTPADNQLMADMMHSSDSDAADILWRRYGGADNMAFNRNFPAYGMTNLQPQQGFSATYPDWGFQKATSDDLDRLMNYTLNQAAPGSDRGHRGGDAALDANQQWGVWEPARRWPPGAKNGWSGGTGRLGGQQRRLRRPPAALHLGHHELPQRRGRLAKTAWRRQPAWPRYCSHRADPGSKGSDVSGRGRTRPGCGPAPRRRSRRGSRSGRGSWYRPGWGR